MYYIHNEEGKMEKKTQRNPFISGGVLVNDSDYFEKDEVNMSNNSLKASLELVNKIRQQKKAEIDNATFLKEEALSDTVKNNDTSSFNTPSEVKNIQEKTIVKKPTYVAPKDDKVAQVFNFDNNPSSPGISLADLDIDNQQEFTEKKDEYLPDYRNEAPVFTSPLQNSNQGGGFDFEYNNQAPQNNVSPVYVEESNENFEQGPQEFVLDGAEHQNEKPKYTINNKDTAGNNKKSKYPQSVSTKEDIKAGKGVAWLSYILFFIPLLFQGKNPFVRWHANEGLELNLLDLLGAGLLVSGWMLESDNILISTIYLAMITIGAIIIALTTFTKIVMVVFCLSGKEARNPWGLRRYRIIK